MPDNGSEKYISDLAERAASAKEKYPEKSPEYFRHILNKLPGNVYLPELYEKIISQAVNENDFPLLQSVFCHIAKIGLLPTSDGYDHCGRFMSLLDLSACADTDNIFRILPEGLPVSKNGYAMYVHGTNILLCLLYAANGENTYPREKIFSKAEKFAASKKPVWERSIISCLSAVSEHDAKRFSEALQELCTGFSRADLAPYRKLQCQCAYGLLVLAKRFFTAEEFAAVTLPENKNFSKGYAEWLFAQKNLSEELCVKYGSPLAEIGEILKKPAAVTRIYRKYQNSDSPYISDAEKKAWYLDNNSMMEELLDAAPGTFHDKNEEFPEKINAGLSETELTKLQRYIGHSTGGSSTEQIIAHIEKINKKTPLTKENWEKLIIPACGNQNTEILTYILERIENVPNVLNYMKHTVMGQEKREEYLLKRIEILKKLMVYLPENEKETALSETLLDAAWYGETKIVKFLISEGADITYRDKNGKDAFEFAKEFSEKFGDDTLYQYLYSYIKNETKQNKNIFGRLTEFIFRTKKQ